MEELALSDLMDLLSEYVRDNIAKKPLQELTEQILIQSDQYDKLCIGIDEIISATVGYILSSRYVDGINDLIAFS